MQPAGLKIRACRPIPYAKSSIAAVIAFAATNPAAGASLFWTTYRYDQSDPSGVNGEVFSVYRADTRIVPDTQVEIIHSLGFQPEYNSLAADTARVYLRRFFSNDIYGMNHDGTGLGLDSPPSDIIGAELYGRVIDAAGAHSYVPDAAAGKILRGDFEFENLVELLATPTFFPNMALALDERSGRIYWAGGGNEANLTLGRANIDGTQAESLAIGDIFFDDYPADIALDLDAGKLY